MKHAFPIVFFIAFCASGFAQTSAVRNMLGAWRLDPARSTYSPGLPPKSLVNTIQAVSGGLKVISDGIDAEGKPTHFEWTAKFDGNDYPVKGDPTRDAISIRKLDGLYARADQ